MSFHIIFSLKFELLIKMAISLEMANISQSDLDHLCQNISASILESFVKICLSAVKLLNFWLGMVFFEPQCRLYATYKIGNDFANFRTMNNYMRHSL
jgi:hypothetical protein